MITLIFERSACQLRNFEIQQNVRFDHLYFKRVYFYTDDANTNKSVTRKAREQLYIYIYIRKIIALINRPLKYKKGIDKLIMLMQKQNGNYTRK